MSVSDIQKILLAAFSSAILVFSSCSDSVSSVSAVTPILVIEYETPESLPKQRLCVFVRPSNEVQRVEKLRVAFPEASLTWNVDKPAYFNGNGMDYVYCDNLRPGNEDLFVPGGYVLEYIDAGGNSDSADFTIKYNSDIMSAKPIDREIKKLLTGCVESLAIYDSEKTLLYMGQPKSEWNDSSAIVKDFRLAEMTRKIFSNGDYSVFCILPFEKIR